MLILISIKSKIKNELAIILEIEDGKKEEFNVDGYDRKKIYAFYDINGSKNLV